MADQVVIDPNPYWVKDPVHKRVKALFDEMETLGKSRSPEEQDAINDALELLSKSLGVPQVECIDCKGQVTYLRTHLHGGYVCGHCETKRRREKRAWHDEQGRLTRERVQACLEGRCEHVHTEPIPALRQEIKEEVPA